MLQQLQAECGDDSGSVDPGLQVNLDRVRLLVNRQPVISSQSSTVSTPSSQQDSLVQQSEKNELTTSDNQTKPKENTEDNTADDTTVQDAAKDCDVRDVRSDMAMSSTAAPPSTMPDIIINSAVVRSHPRNIEKLPDLIRDSLHSTRRVSPRKTPRRVFRLNTLKEIQSTTKETKDNNKAARKITFREVGAKLRDMADNWDDPPQSRRQSLPLLTSDNNHQQLAPRSRRLSSLSSLVTGADTNHDVSDNGVTTRNCNNFDTEQLINNVLKVVQVYGLFLIIRKFENMLK